MRFRVLGSGSSGNTTLVEAGGTRVLVDAGLGPRELAERVQSAGVDPASVDAIVLSHEHQDHARGAPSYSRKWGTKIVGSRGTYAAAGLGAAEIAGYDVLEAGVPFQLGGMTITGIPTPHDAAQPFAFVIEGGGASLGHATDFGHLTQRMADAFRACDALLIESNYDPAMLREGPYPWSLKERILGRWGHLSNGEAAAYLQRDLGRDCRTVVLAHLSRQNNHPEIVRMAVDDALRRRGGPAVSVEITGTEGTEWLAVAPAAHGSRREAPKQLALF
ncbi:MAG TPA: MBL fold metallo-hydrolase [Vicinamibacteria bacterium]|nr:MBL fold metallo-hydrolase [Vicinamibacteria bacterium]